MKSASMVSQTVDFAITLTCFLSTTSSDIGLSSNIYLPLLLNNIASTGKYDIRKDEFIVSSLSHTVKLGRFIYKTRSKRKVCAFLRAVLCKFLLKKKIGMKLVVETQGRPPPPGGTRGWATQWTRKIIQGVRTCGICSTQSNQIMRPSTPAVRGRIRPPEPRFRTKN